MTNLLKSLLIITTLVTPTSVFNHSLETHTEVSKLALNISQTYKVHYADTLVIVKVAKQAAEQFELPLNLVLGVMAVESSFNHSAVSKQGALGLMQIHSSSGVSVGEDIEEHILELLVRSYLIGIVESQAVLLLRTRYHPRFL